MKNILIALLVFGSFGLVGQDNFAITSPEQLQGTAKVELKRECAFLFSRLLDRLPRQYISCKSRLMYIK